MNLFRTIFFILVNQSKNFLKLLFGLPLTTPPIVSMTIDEDDVEIALNWLDRKDEWFSVEEINAYQDEFALWNGSTYAFSFLGGRIALSAIIYALNIQPGEEVILPGYTCVVVPNAFDFAGVKTIFSDIELETFGLDASKIEELISPQTKAILIQHLYGLVNRDYEVILDIAKRHSLFVIEDCAHSAGAEFNGRKVGNWGDVAFYSSERSKVYSTIKGGIATTNNQEIAIGLEKFQQDTPFPDLGLIEKQLYNVIIDFNTFKHHQRWWRGDLAKFKYWDKYLNSTTDDEIIGKKPPYYGLKMPAPIASLGRNQLRKIDHYNELRSISAQYWARWCDENGYKKPRILNGSNPIFLRYPVLVEESKKNNRIWALRSERVQLGVWFLGKKHPKDVDIANCPNSDFAVDHCINFPTSMVNKN